MVGVCFGSDWRREPNIVMLGSGGPFLYHFWMISGPPNVYSLKAMKSMLLAEFSPNLEPRFGIFFAIFWGPNH